jgi:hypothetical protein
MFLNKIMSRILTVISKHAIQCGNLENETRPHGCEIRKYALFINFCKEGALEEYF